MRTELTAAPPAAADGTWAYRPALDGLRTVAIYMVLLFHAGWVHMANGYIGVDVFFVLSGFLVTSIILREHHSTGTLRLRRFYSRRIRRLLPASVVLVVVTCALSVLVLPRLTRASLVSDAQAALLYVANWHFLGSATDYFANDVQRSPFLHFWSLAVEEQFYFVFPLVMLGLLVLGRRRGWTWAVPAGLALLLWFSVCMQWLVARDNPLRAYYGTDTRLYQLLAGAVLAALRHHLRATPRATRWAGVGAIAGVAALCVLASDAVGMSVANRGVLAAALTTAVVAALELAPVGVAHRALSTSPMTYLGRISYSTYLWHWPIIVLVGAGWKVSTPLMVAIAAIGATGAAALSVAVMEMPIRRSKRLDVRPRTVVAVGLTTSLLVAVFVVPPLLHSDRRPTWTANGTGVAIDTAVLGANAASLDAALAARPPTTFDMSVTEPPKFEVTACSSATVAGCILHQGSPKAMKLHLLGDSNAMVLIPLFLQLAERYDFTFSVSARVGCPWQLGLDWQAQDPLLVQQCDAARDDWYAGVLPALRPDVVVAAHVPRDVGSRKDAFFTAGGGAAPGASVQQVVADTTNHTLDRLRALGIRTVLMEPLPYGDVDPTACLSGASTVRECAYSANTTPFPTEATYRTAADQRDDVWDVNADALACPYLPVCVPLIDGELVFRNQFHLSNQWVLNHADAWWSLLVASGALHGWYEPA